MRVAVLDGSSGNSILGSLNSQTASVTRVLYFRRFVGCTEIALMFRLEVDAALAVPVLSNMMCSRSCKGAVNIGFFGVKLRWG